MRILLLSRYGALGASSRVRYLQYLPYFRAQGAEVSVAPLFSDEYVRSLYGGRASIREVIAGYCRRLQALMSASRFDVLIVEKELFPFFPAIAERLLFAAKVPYVVDYDDALFHRYDCHSNPLVRAILGQKIDVVMRYSALVVAGNDYLADRAKEAGARRVKVIPTVVDTNRYGPKQGDSSDVPVVGWIGTPATSHYLMPLVPVFEALRKEASVRFVAVGARAEDFAGTSVQTLPWAESREVEFIQQFDVGIMPLDDSPWERGKCGYKLIQYMACGVPVLASPVGVNKVIVDPGENGLLATTPEEWANALRTLLRADKSARRAMGHKGRAKVDEIYSLDVQAPRLFSLIKDVVG